MFFVLKKTVHVDASRLPAFLFSRFEQYCVRKMITPYHHLHYSVNTENKIIDMSKRKCAQTAAASLSKIAEFERMSEKKRGQVPLKPKDDSSTKEHSPPPKRKKTNAGAALTSSTELAQQEPHSERKNSRGQLEFEDVPDFLPNRTPKEILQFGSFGGTYFRPIYSRY